MRLLTMTAAVTGILCSGATSAAPSVQLTVRDAVVSSGGSPVLSWSSSGATSCVASGGWTGSKALSGSRTVDPITQATTYSLTCNDASGSAVAMVGVKVYGNVTLNWEPATQRTDGTPFTNPAGYRIYYGTGSRNYTSQLKINDPTRTRRTIRLPSGRYYFAITSLDLSGLQSSYSNEVTRRLK